MEALTVVCVCVGTKYSDDYVHRLRDMVDRRLTAPHSFVCMSSRKISSVDCIVAPNLPTWWAKLGLGRPGILPGVKLYFDLDVVLTDSIDGLVADCLVPGKLAARDDFSYSLVNPRGGLSDDFMRFLGGAGTINSSVMVWQDDDLAPIWEEFRVEKMSEVHGDQNWITQAMWPDRINLIPEHWICSYKYHVDRGEPTRPVVVFHGEPKPATLPRDHYLVKIWKGEQ